jgi:arylformamidase
MNLGETMKPFRVTDLTRRLTPGEPTNSYGWKRRLELERITFPNQPTQIAHDLTINSHLGTHVESPSHMLQGAGMNVADFAPETFIGEAVLAEVTHRAPRGSVTAQDLETATDGKVQRGDILLIWGRYKPEDRPSISLAAAQWIVEHGVKMIGFDSVDGIDPDAHDLILGNNIPMLEEIVNLDRVQGQRVFLVALPIPIVGLDACPVRAVVLEDSIEC